MDYSLPWDSSFLQPVVCIGITLFGLLGYWISIHSESLKAKFVKVLGEEKTVVEWIMFWRYSGLLFYGIIPAVIVFTLLPHDAGYYGLKFVNIPATLLWTAVIGGLLVLAQSKSGRKPENTVQYPQIRINDWTAGLFLKNAFGWTIYLLAYEFMYRGVLLLGIVEIIGTWPAIIVNVAIYSLAHVPKGNREALMAIPFGILLCWLTIATETIWIAFLTHIILAYANDYFAILGSKTMRFVKNK